MISSISPEIKINVQKRSIFHPTAHDVLDSQCKKRYFWMVPEPLVQQLKKKNLWGSGYENGEITESNARERFTRGPITSLVSDGCLHGEIQSFTHFAQNSETEDITKLVCFH